MRNNNIDGTIDDLEDSVFDKSMKPMLEMSAAAKSERSQDADLLFDAP